jgi:3,4-dihydroxy 2-butanone 4-phosphate synthase/GTP cyclohydrolase II
VMRLASLRRLADEHRLPLISIADLVSHRRHVEGAVPVPVLVPPATPATTPLTTGTAGSTTARVERAAEGRLPTEHGAFRALAYRDLLTGAEHLALVAGTPPARGALVRVHSECLTGDALGSARCDCGPQLGAAMAAVAAEGGVIVYVRGHEGRGIGLLAKLAAYGLQDAGLDTVAANTAQGLPADAREYGAAAAVLADLGLDRIRLLTNNPAKLTGLAAHGITTDERVPLHVGLTAHNAGYLAAKRDLMGHEFDATMPGGSR